MSLTFSIEAEPSSATTNWLVDRLIAFNESQAGPRNARNFAILGRDEDESLLAGLLCNCHWNFSGDYPNR